MTGETRSANQQQTEDAFAFKWRKRDTYESAEVQAEWGRWLLTKYFGGDEAELDRLLGTDAPKKILDAGCGSGGSGLLLFGDRLKVHEYVGVDISDAVYIAQERFRERGIPAVFVQSDINMIPAGHGPFDLVFSEGVLHHTDSVETAILALSKQLKPSGRLLFYVYSKKAPIREFTDDHVREAVAGMSNEAAWHALMPLTKLGKALGELDIEILVEEDIPFLGIAKGKYNLQRLFYYKFCKAYFRPEYSLDEMNHINFDWYRPLNCHRHSPEEVVGFCERAGLTLERLHVEESGISVIARK
jgi:SAM-dependent methyltransferase